jgi:hypothetical protein
MPFRESFVLRATNANGESTSEAVTLERLADDEDTFEWMRTSEVGVLPATYEFSLVDDAHQDRTYEWTFVGYPEHSGFGPEPRTLSFPAPDCVKVRLTVTAGEAVDTRSDTVCVDTEPELPGGVGSVPGGTSLGGTLSEALTLRIQDSPYVGGLTIEDGGSLTIPRGVVLKNSSIAVEAGGELNATGAVFTSIKDDALAGDTNRDGDATSPEPGDWSSIWFKPGSRGILDDVTVRYGGRIPWNHCGYGVEPHPYCKQLYIQSDDVVVRNSRISNAETQPVVVRQASPDLIGNVITNNAEQSGTGLQLVESNARVEGNRIFNAGAYGIHALNCPDLELIDNQVFGHHLEPDRSRRAPASRPSSTGNETEGPNGIYRPHQRRTPVDTGCSPGAWTRRRVSVRPGRAMTAQP